MTLKVKFKDGKEDTFYEVDRITECYHLTLKAIVFILQMSMINFETIEKDKVERMEITNE